MNASAGDAGFVSLDARSAQCALDQILRVKKQRVVTTTFCVLNVGLCFPSAGSVINPTAQITAVVGMRLQPLMLRLGLRLNVKLVTIGQVQTHMKSTIKSEKHTCCLQLVYFVYEKLGL